MYDVVTFGEAMVRALSPNSQRLEQTQSLDVHVGGAELNVAVGVTRFGMKSAWISKLPKNGLGNNTRFGGGPSLWRGLLSRCLVRQGRAGLYFCPIWSIPQGIERPHDRANSAISMIQPGECFMAER